MGASFNTGSIIGLVIAVILVAYLAPSAVESFYMTNISNWSWDGGTTEDTKTTAIWKLMPLIACVVFLAMIAKYAGLF